MMLLMFLAMQTPEQRVDNIIADAERVVAEAKQLKADIAHQHTMLPLIDSKKIPTAQAGFAEARVKMDDPIHSKPRQNTDGTGQFRITCTFSHMNYDDPIVYAGKQGASHLHTYFGNTAVNYASTQASIETTGNSTCSGGTANRSGYWVPALIDTKDGTPIKPSSIMVYYKSDAVPYGNVKPFPVGLRMVSGDMKATGPQPRIGWTCLLPNGGDDKHTSIPANCPVGGAVVAVINFPMCWDGVNLDSPDHKSHMSFPVWDNVNKKVICPTTHTVQLPGITERVQYAVTEAGQVARWRLSSDNYGTEKPGGYSLHADWFNGWDAKVQETWVKNCLQAKMDCHGNLLGDGTTLF